MREAEIVGVLFTNLNLFAPANAEVDYSEYDHVLIENMNKIQGPWPAIFVDEGVPAGVAGVRVSSSAIVHAIVYDIVTGGFEGSLLWQGEEHGVQ